MTDFQLDDLDTTTVADKGIAVPLTKVDGVTPLLNANKEPVELILHGQDSKTYRDASRAGARARLERSQSNKVQPGSDASLDLLDEDLVTLLASCTSGWNGVLDSKGKPVPFNREACAEFYRRFPSAREQADRAIMTRALFTKASSGA